jgi:hypothetical protein
MVVHEIRGWAAASVSLDARIADAIFDNLADKTAEPIRSVGVARVLHTPRYSRRTASRDNRQMETPLMAVDLKDHLIAGVFQDADSRLRTR